MKDNSNATGEIPLHAWADFRRMPGYSRDCPHFAMQTYGEFSPEAQANYPHRHDFFEVAYIAESDPGEHHIDFEQFPIQKDSLFFISPGQVHFWRQARPLIGYALIFPDEFLVTAGSNQNIQFEFAFFNSVNTSPHLDIPGDEAEEFGQILESMATERRERREGFVGILRSQLHVLLARSQRLIVETEEMVEPPASYALARRFKKLVSGRFIHDRGVSAYAKRLGVSAGHLHGVVKSVLGTSPSRVIQNEVTTEAKRLLAHTSLSVAEIAYLLNFADPSYFGRYFRRQTGKTPGDFRDEVLTSTGQEMPKSRVS